MLDAGWVNINLLLKKYRKKIFFVLPLTLVQKWHNNVRPCIIIVEKKTNL